MKNQRFVIQLKSNMLNRQQERENLFKKFEDLKSTSAIFLSGGKSETRYNTDVDIIFRQESNFW